VFGAHDVSSTPIEASTVDWHGFPHAKRCISNEV
jgi:hypothetical protein